MVPIKIRSIYSIMKTSTYTGQLRCKHFAIAIRNGKAVTPILCNKYRTYVFGEVRGTLHAEMAVIKHIFSLFNLNYNIKLTKHNQNSLKYNKLNKFLKKITIIVIRIGANGKILNSKPCHTCLNTMKLLHIRHIYYTDTNGHLESKCIKSLTTSHQSKLQLHINIKKLY